MIAGVLGTAGLAGCGHPGEGGTALALADPRWDGPQRIIVTVECAQDVVAQVEPGAGTEGLPLVTIDGRPKVGRCRPEVALDIPAGTTRVEDAATGTVIDLPAR